MDPTVTASDPAAQLMDPGPSWNVPRISLPECMGVLKQYQTEWWYYVGYAFTAEGEEFSLQFEFLRAALPGQARGGCLWPWRRHTLELQVVAGPVGIGIRSINAYVWAPGFGFGVAEKPGPHHSLTVLPATDAQYGLTLTPLIGSRLSVAYTGGAPVATVGSTYRLQASGKYEETSFAFDLSFTDRRGLVMEGSSGYVGVARDSGGGA
ncbi:MAG TPA: hypothetical protein VFX98_01840 [Longimicrobiaceae bacterium]|nr:hypothetical protein [Longimicrobiaceae bacterium]